MGGRRCGASSRSAVDRSCSLHAARLQPGFELHRVGRRAFGSRKKFCAFGGEADAARGLGPRFDVTFGSVVGRRTCLAFTE